MRHLTVCFDSLFIPPFSFACVSSLHHPSHPFPTPVICPFPSLSLDYAVSNLSPTLPPSRSSSPPSHAINSSHCRRPSVRPSLPNHHSEEVCKHGFTVIVDMRGSKWDSIKPLLKILQESFPSCIHVALIIKPDNFWQKQRTNFGSSKFEFEVRRRQTSSVPRKRNLNINLNSLAARWVHFTSCKHGL